MHLEEIIIGCKKQNRNAQQALYEQYKKTLFVLSLKYCSSESEAEDNLQDAFLEIFSNIKNYKGTGSFEGWMKKITIFKAIKKYHAQKNIFKLEENFILIDEYELNFNEIAISLDQILALIQQLPNQYRLVFNLYELDNYTHKEIATMLSISENTSKSNLHRAKLILKENLKKMNLSNKNIIYNAK